MLKNKRILDRIIQLKTVVYIFLFHNMNQKLSSLSINVYLYKYFIR